MLDTLLETCTDLELILELTKRLNAYDEGIVSTVEDDSAGRALNETATTVAIQDLDPSKNFNASFDFDKNGKLIDAYTS